MKIVIGSDHGGFELKNKVKSHLIDNEIEVCDCGAFNEDSVDYPDIAQSVCKKVLENDDSFGILICGTGIGISISANKINGIRAALLTDGYSAKMAKEHNNANVICLGGRTIGSDLANFIVDEFLTSTFQGDRHIRRINKITELENN